MKHDPSATANAAAVTTAVIYAVCALSITFAPELSMSIAKTWFHGIDITQISAWNITADSLVLGLVTATVGAWLIGYLFARLYNFFLKK